MTLQVTFAPQARRSGRLSAEWYTEFSFLLPEQQDMQQYSTAVQALHCTDCIRVGKMQQKSQLCQTGASVFTALTQPS